MHVLREAFAKLLANDGLVLRDQRLPVFAFHLGIVVEALVFLGDFQGFLEQAMIEAEDDVGIHLDEPAIAVPGEARIARGGGKPFHRFVVQAQVEDGVHHPRHGNARAGTDRYQQRIGCIAKLLLGRFLYVLQGLGDCCLQLIRKITAFLQVADAFVCRDCEAGGHGQADGGHFRQIGALAASNGLVLLPRIRMRSVAAEGEDRIVHRVPSQGDEVYTPSPNKCLSSR